MKEAPQPRPRLRLEVEEEAFSSRLRWGGTGGRYASYGNRLAERTGHASGHLLPHPGPLPLGEGAAWAALNLLLPLAPSNAGNVSPSP